MKSMEKDNPEEGRRVGTCKFCGQTHIINTLMGVPIPMDQIDDWTTDKCNCPEARELRTRKESGEKAKKNIIKLFGENTPVSNIFIGSISAVIDEYVESVQINIADGVKGVLSLGKTGRVRVKKTTTLTDEFE